MARYRDMPRPRGLGLRFARARDQPSRTEDRRDLAVRVLVEQLIDQHHDLPTRLAFFPRGLGTVSELVVPPLKRTWIATSAPLMSVTSSRMSRAMRLRSRSGVRGPSTAWEVPGHSQDLRPQLLVGRQRIGRASALVPSRASSGPAAGCSILPRAHPRPGGCPGRPACTAAGPARPTGVGLDFPRQ